jgi:NDMA-dependent alcohol dehydrogenase
MVSKRERSDKGVGMKTSGALLWEPGTNSGWSVEEIEIDPPQRREVMVQLAASGICHSDQHLDDGVIPLPWAPVLGGHEGAGVVTEVGPEVHDLEVGDHVVLSFLPSCGRCRMCVSGRSNMCELGARVLAGVAPDGTHRVHARNKDVGCMSFLGTFAPYVCAPVDAVVKIDKDIPLDKAALLGCGVPTGWGSSVYGADMQLGDTVVVVGIGGVGINAVQGARHKGAKNIIAIDPVPFKQEKAQDFGATHAVSNYEQAAELVRQTTNGQGADRVILTVGVMRGDLLEPAQAMTRRGGVIVMTSAAPVLQIDLFTFAMSGKRLQGTLYGSTNSRTDVPLLCELYRTGQLKLDELITRTYKLEDINQAFADMQNGLNLRGVIMYD